VRAKRRKRALAQAFNQSEVVLRFVARRIFERAARSRRRSKYLGPTRRYRVSTNQKKLSIKTEEFLKDTQNISAARD
jgi:hypothetical protein